MMTETMDFAEEVEENRDLVLKANRKNKKSGGFQSMGLSPSVFRGILKKGYKVPTPIQRKTIPPILSGKDVVAMARTGSGKTAAFLIPLMEKLGRRNPGSNGIRALILSPTRELAMQTGKFFKELSKFTDLKSIYILGGDSMERQFAEIHGKPDVLIVTPGRFVHLCLEMSLKLEDIQYVVLDEADRLFEMGFGEQLTEILRRLPDHRQTALFSATLPKLLVDFAKAGLNDPTLIRLNVDDKIPETLKLGFFHCRAEGKNAALIHLLKEIIPRDEQTIVFAATRHHVEFLHVLCDLAEISNTFIYSQLDASARKINAAKFVAKKCSVLLVTDLAARGIDIPLLDNVINYNFPAKSKLFVHRVGRVARAGRSGRAYSLVAGDELAYFIDLQLFFGNPVKLIDKNASKDSEDWHNSLGAIPQSIHDEYADNLKYYFDISLDLTNLSKVAQNGYSQYLKSRPGASVESIKRVKTVKNQRIEVHPLLIRDGEGANKDKDRLNMLEQMKSFRPPSTIFEIGNTAKNTNAKNAMSKKRNKHENVIDKIKSNKERQNNEEVDEVEQPPTNNQELEQSTNEDLIKAFGTKIVQPKAAKEVKMPKRNKFAKDAENYIGYQSKDYHSEAGYSMMKGFEAEASNATMDLTGDDGESIRKKRNVMKWDSKSKKYVRNDESDKKKIKTESGVWIPASYKSDRYKKWKERSKLAQTEEQGGEEDDQQTDYRNNSQKRKLGNALPSNHPAMKKARNSVPAHRKGPKNEILRPEQIMKKRKEEDKKRQKNVRRNKKNKK